MKKLLLATAFVLAAGAAHAQQGTQSEIRILNSCCSKVAERFKAECFYGKTDHDFFDSPDRYAHMRSVEEYHRIVANADDRGGFCRSAGHIRECLVSLNELLNRIAAEPKDNKPINPADEAYARAVEELERGDESSNTAVPPMGTGPSAVDAKNLPGAWVKSADVACNVLDECYLVDNYTNAHKRGEQCVLFAIPIYNRPHGKIVGSLSGDVPLVRRDSQRRGFTHVKSDGISSNTDFDFSGCG
jgi:hypothetical protein